MRPREYCCCAIPVIYTGIYTTLTEQFALGIIAGSLSVGTPSIVGAATPGFAKVLFGIVCYVGAALQLFGFAAVRRENSSLFRRYNALHVIVTVAAFSLAAVWIIISAVRHNTAVTNCKNNFYSGTSTIMETEGNDICKYFPWADVGIMAGLWVLLAIVQLYLLFVLLSYAAGMRRDDQTYDTLYDPSKPFASDIPLATRGDPWEASPLTADRGYHNRSDSVASLSTVMGDKTQQHREYDGYHQETFQAEPSGITGNSRSRADEVAE